MTANDDSQLEPPGIHDDVIAGFAAGVLRHLQREPQLVNARNESGETPLHLAVKHGHGNIAKLLLDAGASTTIMDKHGATPVALARRYGQRTILTQLEQAQERELSRPAFGPDDPNSYRGSPSSRAR